MARVAGTGPDKHLLPPRPRPAPPRTSSAGPVAALQGCGAAWTLPLSAPDHPYAAAFKLLPGLRDYFAGLDHANGSSATPDAIRSPPPPTNPHPYAELFRLQPGLREYFARLTKAGARRPRPGQLGTSASGPKDHPYAEIFRGEPWLPEFLKDVYAVRPASAQGRTRPQAHPFGADPGVEGAESPGVRCALDKLAKVGHCIRLLQTQDDARPPADRQLAEGQVRVLLDHRLPIGARMGALAFLSEAADREAAQGCQASPTPPRKISLNPGYS
ncbi:hypothetical protein L6R50_28145 [Myxococcota bacterium]|nr:hypothetical protein [Myxococcota bacterium]